MSRVVVRIAIVMGLVGVGWVAGRAQGTRPDFEIVVKAPIGDTEVTCVRGCELAWVERVVPESITGKSATFRYGCSGPVCESGRIGGWLRRPN